MLGIEKSQDFLKGKFLFLYRIALVVCAVLSTGAGAKSDVEGKYFCCYDYYYLELCTV